MMTLLASGADPRVVRRCTVASDKSGMRLQEKTGTAFHFALPNVLYNIPLLQAFLENGADPNTMSNARETDTYEHVLHMAVSLKLPKVAQILLDAGAHIDA